MSAGIVLFGLFQFAMGLYLGSVLWGDDRGKFYIPENVGEERSGWIHDGKLFTYERDMSAAETPEGQ